jgi:multicomponent Na+:H+ antiporter subunit G
MTLLDALTFLLMLAALFFFTAGTIGLLRLPDAISRLHALTKADNVGLGLVVLALMLKAHSLATVFKLALIWIIVLAAGSTVCFLIAARARSEAAPTEEETIP